MPPRQRGKMAEFFGWLGIEASRAPDAPEEEDPKQAAS
jgi:hypothetical protein